MKRIGIMYYAACMLPVSLRSDKDYIYIAEITIIQKSIIFFNSIPTQELLQSHCIRSRLGDVVPIFYYSLPKYLSEVLEWPMGSKTRTWNNIPD